MSEAGAVPQVSADNTVFGAKEAAAASTVRSPSAPTSVVLVGASGSGKTAVGQELSALTGHPFYDVDTETAHQMEDSVAALVIRAPEQFEQTRRDIALYLLRTHRTDEAIIAIGASQSHDAAVVDALRQASASGAHIVELTADITHIARRMGLNVPRSVALGTPRATLTTMVDQLHRINATLADVEIDTNHQTAAEAAQRIAQTL